VEKHEIIIKGISGRFGEIKLSMSEIQNIAERITFGNMRDGIEAFAAASLNAENAMENLRTSALDLSKINWKARTGIDFDIGEYRTGIDSFIGDAKSNERKIKRIRPDYIYFFHRGTRG
jgi:hypothetical protein